MSAAATKWSRPATTTGQLVVQPDAVEVVGGDREADQRHVDLAAVYDVLLVRPR